MVLRQNYTTGDVFAASDVNAITTAVNLMAVVPTAVKTSAYTAASGDLVPCNAASAAFTVTLPLAPTDGATVVVKKVDSSTNAVAVACAGSSVFDVAAGATTRTLVIQFQAVQFQYAATTGVWYSTAVHGVAATAATANTLAARDTNIYLTARGFIPGFTTTSTAAGTTTLTIASNSIQEFTGSSTQTVVLPTTSVVAGQQWAIINNSTGAVAVQSSSLAALHTVAPGTEAIFTALIANPTTAAHWEDSFFGTNFAAGKKLTVNNTMTLSGTDGTTFAFPSTDATVARTDAAQTFTGIQTMTSPALTTPAITGAITGTYSFGGTPTGLPVSAITASTSTALGVGSVELGHATDTTLTRSAAGVLAVEGFDVQTKSVVSVTGTTTLGAVAGREYIVLLGSGAVATLPTAVSNTSIYHLKNVHTASLTVAVTSSQTIDGGTGSITVLPQQCYSLVSNGTNWVII